MPRNFAWITKDRLAVNERPGGYAPNHRKIRRQEELLWLRARQFDRIASLLPSSHNLHAYDELLLHQDELGDRVMGVVAGYLRWSGILPGEPKAITIIEQLLKWQIGSAGRVIVTIASELPMPEMQ